MTDGDVESDILVTITLGVEQQGYTSLRHIVQWSKGVGKCVTMCPSVVLDRNKSKVLSVGHATAQDCTQE